MPGFENAILGMTAGEIKNVSIPPENAYGDYQKNLVAVIEKSQLPPHINPQVGSMLTVQTGDGKALNVAITDITDIKVTLDANHPLAGKELLFDLELVAIA